MEHWFLAWEIFLLDGREAYMMSVNKEVEISNAFLASASPPPLECQLPETRLEGEVRKMHFLWMRIKLGSPWVLLECTDELWGSWQMSWWGCSVIFAWPQQLGEVPQDDENVMKRILGTRHMWKKNTWSGQRGFSKASHTCPTWWALLASPVDEESSGYSQAVTLEILIVKLLR